MVVILLVAWGVLPLDVFVLLDLRDFVLTCWTTLFHFGLSITLSVRGSIEFEWYVLLSASSNIPGSITTRLMWSLMWPFHLVSVFLIFVVILCIELISHINITILLICKMHHWVLSLVCFRYTRAVLVQVGSSFIVTLLCVQRWRAEGVSDVANGCNLLV